MRQMLTGCCAQCQRRTLNSLEGLERSYFICVECTSEDQMVQTYNMGMDQPLAFIRDVYNALEESTVFTAAHGLESVRSALSYIVHRESIMV